MYNVNASAATQIGSFVQDQAHQTKTQKFVPIQPSQIATVLNGHGFDLVSLKAGKARLADRADHQTTIARYRSKDPLVIQSGGRDLYMDLVFKVPHLYGALEAFVGTWRQVCSNGLVVGHKFASAKVRHVGNALSQLEKLIPGLIQKHDDLVSQIRAMMARNVTPAELAQFTTNVANLRLGQNQSNIVSVQYGDLLKVRRDEDKPADLFTILNVVQENIMRHGMRYQIETTDTQGFTSRRNQLARPVSRTRTGEFETSRSVDLNGSIWDEALKILETKQAA